MCLLGLRAVTLTAKDADKELLVVSGWNWVTLRDSIEYLGIFGWNMRNKIPTVAPTAIIRVKMKHIRQQNTRQQHERRRFWGLLVLGRGYVGGSVRVGGGG